MPGRDLNAPSAGLRPPGVRLVNKSNDVAKVQLAVAAGAELEVDADVAAQLMGQTQAFAPTGPPAKADAADAAETAGGGAARRRSGSRG